MDLQLREVLSCFRLTYYWYIIIIIKKDEIEVLLSDK